MVESCGSQDGAAFPVIIGSQVFEHTAEFVVLKQINQLKPRFGAAEADDHVLLIIAVAEMLVLRDIGAPI